MKAHVDHQSCVVFFFKFVNQYIASSCMLFNIDLAKSYCSLVVLAVHPLSTGSQLGDTPNKQTQLTYGVHCVDAPMLKLHC